MTAVRIRADGTPRCRECSADPEPDRQRCADCARTHAQREAERRKARLRAERCVVCGQRAARRKGETLTVCSGHREYYRARDAQRRAIDGRQKQ